MKNKGAAIILVAGITLCFLLLFAVLAIDFSRMYYVRGELQNAADAAALAGAAKLDGTTSTTQTLARQEAWKFACKNRAAQAPVYLVTNASTDCDSPPDGPNDLNQENDPDGDIIVGHWTTTIPPPSGHAGHDCMQAGSGCFCRAKNGSTGLTINALKARPRRTSAGSSYGMGPVTLLFGKLIAGLTDMGVVRQAIASMGGLTAPGLSICTNTCNNLSPSPANPVILVLAPKSEEGNDIGIAWTAFDDKQAPKIGKKGDVVDYIWGKKLTNPCGKCITTNNGVGEAFKELEDAFESTTYDTANKTISSGKVVNWTVSVPVVTQSPLCTGTSCGCPPGSQGHENETYFIIQVAKMRIIDVGQFENVKGVKIDQLQCDVCPNITFGGVRLVK